MDQPVKEGGMDTPLIEETCKELQRLLALGAERLEPDLRQEILRVTRDLTPANLLESYGRLNAHPKLSLCFGRAVTNLLPRLRISLKARSSI